VDANGDDKWLSRQEVADRYGVPAKTLAQWASQAKGPRYAKFGKHVRYLLSDVIAWERGQFDKRHRDSA
jgi:predicted DNA-binding transcriptional regulator AlpA